jgi:hypothetical protein
VVNSVLWPVYAGVGVVDTGILDCCVNLYGSRVPTDKQMGGIPGVAVYYMDVLCDIP